MFIFRRYAVLFLFSSLSALGSACSSSPNGPTPLPLQLACPVPITVPAQSSSGALVSFAIPIPTGGTIPRTVSCSPSTGALFPIGASTSTCTAQDSTGTVASCTVSIQVEAFDRLTKTSFLAFGDSITEGIFSDGPTRDLVPTISYPYFLEGLLRTRYPTQTAIRVVNRGLGGDKLSDGRAKLPGVLDADRPEVLLLQEGTNAIWATTTAALGADLRAMVDAARSRGIDVILGNLLPVAADKDLQFPGYSKAIRDFNVEILRVASEKGLGKVVDFNRLFTDNPGLLGFDGLHPRSVGYTAMANLVFEEVVARYGVR